MRTTALARWHSSSPRSPRSPRSSASPAVRSWARRWGPRWPCSGRPRTPRTSLPGPVPHTGGWATGAAIGDDESLVAHARAAGLALGSGVRPAHRSLRTRCRCRHRPRPRPLPARCRLLGRDSGRVAADPYDLDVRCAPEGSGAGPLSLSLQAEASTTGWRRSPLDGVGETFALLLRQLPTLLADLLQHLGGLGLRLVLRLAFTLLDFFPACFTGWARACGSISRTDFPSSVLTAPRAGSRAATGSLSRIGSSRPVPGVRPRSRATPRDTHVALSRLTSLIPHRPRTHLARKPHQLRNRTLHSAGQASSHW